MLKIGFLWIVVHVTLPIRDFIFDVKKTQSCPEYFETNISHLPVILTQRAYRGNRKLS